MTKEKLEERMKALETSFQHENTRKSKLQMELRQTEANIQAVSGAMQDVEFWLGELAKEEDKTVTEAVTEEAGKKATEKVSEAVKEKTLTK